MEFLFKHEMSGLDILMLLSSVFNIEQNSITDLNKSDQNTAINFEYYKTKGEIKTQLSVYIDKQILKVMGISDDDDRVIAELMLKNGIDQVLIDDNTIFPNSFILLKSDGSESVVNIESNLE